MLGVVPALAITAAAMGLVFAPDAKADCNTVTNSTLCASGTVSGSAGAPTSVPQYSPFPCYGNPACDYYDIYDPGISWDLPHLGGNRPRPPPQPRLRN